MKNIPRIYINGNLEVGKSFALSRDQAHYLTKVMRTTKFLVFNNGVEFYAELVGAELYSARGSHIMRPLQLTHRPDPSNNLTLAFAPIKQSRMEEMIAMATQMGVATLQPVITERVNEKFPKWERIRKIMVEAAEQSGRNSIPKLLEPIGFKQFVETRDPRAENRLVFADERLCNVGAEFHSARGSHIMRPLHNDTIILIGPEGGFSPAEFAALDATGAIGISLGKTILRAETAAVVAISKVNSE